MPRALFGNITKRLVRLAARAAEGLPNPEELSTHAKQLWLDGLRNLAVDLLMQTRAGRNGCLEWIGAKDGGGYGVTYAFGRSWKASRLFYFLWTGTIPEGHLMCHKCDNPSCVRPSHLFPGTAKENIYDCIRKGRFTGPKGVLNGSAKLSAKQVRQIRSMYRRRSRKGRNMYDLAREFQISPTTVHGIIHGRRWRHHKL